MNIPNWLKTLTGQPDTAPHRFHGGLHVPGHKSQSTRQPSRALPLADTYYLSLRQRNGLLQTPLVAVGERVLRGQPVTLENGAGSVPRHAPTSGTVIAIQDHDDIHPSGQNAPAIIIRPDGHDQSAPALPALDWQNSEAQPLLERIHACGISGLGGAGFPTARKLKHPTKTLVINAAECEPYITCDDLQIREHAASIVLGAQIAAHILGAERILFGIEDDKPQAIAALQSAIAASADPRIRLHSVPTRYPSGNSRQLFELLLGIRVPADQHAADYGLICHNSATIKAIHDAVLLGQPLTERYVTLTGEALVAPQVVRARIGTPIDWLIRQAGGTIGEPRLIIGGPMMGHPQTISRAGLKKTSNCLLLLPALPAPREENCIRCARCAEACPMELLPQQLYWYSRNGEAKRLDQYRLFDCIECGICASVCPSAIPLVDYYRHSKASIRAEKRKQQAADHAKTRHEAREARLEREAQEREAKMAAKRAALQQPRPDPTETPHRKVDVNPPAEPKTSAEIAIASSQNPLSLRDWNSSSEGRDRGRGEGENPPSTTKPETSTPLPHKEKNEKEGEQTEALPDKAPEPFNPTAQAPADPDKTDAIAAAKARAAARKAARLAQNNPPTEPEASSEPASTETDPLTAAKAKAAARKAARLAQNNPPAETEQPSDIPDRTRRVGINPPESQGDLRETHINPSSGANEPALKPLPPGGRGWGEGEAHTRNTEALPSEPSASAAQPPAEPAPSDSDPLAAAKAKAAARKAARLKHNPSSQDPPP